MILDFLLERFPDHAMTAEIANYRKVLQSIGKPVQAGACAAS